MAVLQLPQVELIRHAIEFGIGAVSANLGLASATEWAELLEQDPLHQVNAGLLNVGYATGG